MKTKTQTGSTPCDDKGRGWHDASTSDEHSALPGSMKAQDSGLKQTLP